MKKLLLLLLLAGVGALAYYAPIIAFKQFHEGRKAFRSKIAKNAVKVHFDADRFASGSHIIAPSGKTYVLTNYHVCASYSKSKEGEDAFYVGISKSIDEEKQIKMMKVITADIEKDLCLVEPIQQEGFKLAKELKRGESVFLLGHPSGSELLLMEGEYVSPKSIIVAQIIGFFILPIPYDSAHISNMAYGGNSGSAVLNNRGELSGVLFAGSDNVKIYNFMVQLDKVKEFLKNY